MAWKQTVFERQALYDEIWAEPMTTVAQRYGLSDVGLRKICVKLGIPVPPRGYWARLAAGQRPEKQPLRASKAPTTVVRSIRVDEQEEECEQRVANARMNEAPLPVLKDLVYTPPGELTGVGVEAAYIAKAMGKIRETEGCVSLSCGAWADVAVSEDSRFRAIVLLDKLAFAVKAADGIFDLKSSPRNEVQNRHRSTSAEDRGSFQFHGTRYFFRIKEKILRQEIVESAPAKSPTRGRSRMAYEPDFSSMFRPKKYSFTPTGKFQLVVCRVACSYEVAKTEDTPHTTSEEKVVALVGRVEALSLTKKIEDQLQYEKRMERERKTKIWETEKARKDALLKQLESYEQMARNLDRAESLRRLAEKILALASTQPLSKEEHIAHLIVMADWLDPTVAKRWPEVDDVPDKNPHFSWY
jgi:hypothetical protein